MGRSDLVVDGAPRGALWMRPGAVMGRRGSAVLQITAPTPRVPESNVPAPAAPDGWAPSPDTANDAGLDSAAAPTDPPLPRGNPVTKSRSAT